MNPIEDPAADEYRVQAQMTKLEDAGAKPKDGTPPAATPPPRTARRPRTTRRTRRSAWRQRPRRGRGAPAHAPPHGDDAREEGGERGRGRAQEERLEPRGARPSGPAASTRSSASGSSRAYEAAGLALDVITARHPAARVRPADLDAVAAAWTAVDLRAVRPTEAERARGAGRRRPRRPARRPPPWSPPMPRDLAPTPECFQLPPGRLGDPALVPARVARRDPLGPLPAAGAGGPGARGRRAPRRRPGRGGACPRRSPTS